MRTSWPEQVHPHGAFRSLSVMSHYQAGRGGFPQQNSKPTSLSARGTHDIGFCQAIQIFGRAALFRPPKNLQRPAQLALEYISVAVYIEGWGLSPDWTIPKAAERLARGRCLSPRIRLASFAPMWLADTFSARYTHLFIFLKGLYHMANCRTPRIPNPSNTPASWCNLCAWWF